MDACWPFSIGTPPPTAQEDNQTIMPKTPKTPPEDYEPFAPPPAAPPPARAVIVVIPPGPYSPQEYADAAAAMARDFQYHPTPAPQLAEALRRAVSGWADAQQLNN